MTDYTKQADDFLAKHGLTFRAVYLETAPYFDDDKDRRDIYRLTLSGKGRGRFSTKFGSSIVDTRNNAVPTAYDLLACLEKYDPGTFENFCGDLGYSTDSRSAERTYRAVKRQWNRVQRFFTAEELAELETIQ